MTRSRDVADTQDNLGGAVAPFVAGKNKIINGDFSVWQRGTNFTNQFGTNYCADRFIYNADTTPTVSQQAFAIGDIPGYNPQFYLRFVKGNTTTDAMAITQRIEDVRTFAGQTVTLSFWAKASAAYTNAPLTRQMFGTGGSADVYTTFTTQSITTSWARYSMTFTMPSVSGKTIGAGSYLEPYFIRHTGSANITVDVWGVQLEAGSVATPFQTASGSIGGELALCQRYYEKSYPYANLPGSTTSQQGLVSYQAVTSTAINNRCWVPFVVSKRTDSPTITIYNYNNGASGFALNENTGVYSVAIQFQSNRGFNLYPTSGTFAAGQVCNFYYTADSEL
jgi:hypothetical protein